MATPSVGLRAKIRLCGEMLENIKAKLIIKYGPTFVSPIPDTEDAVSFAWFAKTGRHVKVSLRINKKHGLLQLECPKYVFSGNATPGFKENTMCVILVDGAHLLINDEPTDSTYTFGCDPGRHYPGCESSQKFMERILFSVLTA